ncbi:MAG: hypothetical protein WBK55_01135 [Alphaproteobacteria bacterium]
MKHFSIKDTLTPTLSLFFSAGTLVCCALPALFISLGMGASLAGLVGAFPQIVWLSEYKLAVFSFAAVMLAVAGVMTLRARNLPCPADPAQARACTRLRRISAGIYIFSLVAFLIGAFFAFVAPYFI